MFVRALTNFTIYNLTVKLSLYFHFSITHDLHEEQCFAYVVWECFKLGNVLSWINKYWLTHTAWFTLHRVMNWSDYFSPDGKDRPHKHTLTLSHHSHPLADKQLNSYGNPKLHRKFPQNREKETDHWKVGYNTFSVESSVIYKRRTTVCYWITSSALSRRRDVNHMH